MKVPFSKEACEALLISADDAYAIVHGMVYKDANFRNEEVEAVLKEGKASSPGSASTGDQ